MKGGIGIAAGTMGVGRGASGGAGVFRGFGSSNSPEARPGNFATQFSSKSFSEFKPVFKTPQIPKGMFDMSRPVVPNPIGKYVPKASIKSEFGITVQMQNGREIRPNKARTPSLIPQKPMFDLGRKPQPELGKRFFVNPRKSSEIQIAPKTEVRDSSSSLYIKTHEKQPKVRTEKIKASKRVKMGHVIQVVSSISQNEKIAIFKDIKDAKKTLYVVARARNVSIAAARQEMVQVLAKKHEGKVKVLPTVELYVKTQIKTAVQPKAEVRIETQKATAVNVEQQTNPREKREISQEKKIGVEEKKLYFRTDERANEKRIKRVLETFNKLAKKSKPNQITTGWDIEREMRMEDMEEISELTRLQGFDKRLNAFKDGVRWIGYIFDVRYLGKLIHSLVRRYSAVRLAGKDNKGDALIGQDAEEVYGQSLNNVDAYVEDEGSNGKLRANASAQKVVVIKRGREEIIYNGVKNGENTATVPESKIV